MKDSISPFDQERIDNAEIPSGISQELLDEIIKEHNENIVRYKEEFKRVIRGDPLNETYQGLLDEQREAKINEDCKIVASELSNDKICKRHDITRF